MTVMLAPTDGGFDYKQWKTTSFPFKGLLIHTQNDAFKKNQTTKCDPS